MAAVVRWRLKGDPHAGSLVGSLIFGWGSGTLCRLWPVSNAPSPPAEATDCGGRSKTHCTGFLQEEGNRAPGPTSALETAKSIRTTESSTESYHNGKGRAKEMLGRDVTGWSSAHLRGWASTDRAIMVSVSGVLEERQGIAQCAMLCACRPGRSARGGRLATPAAREDQQDQMATVPN